MKIVTPVLTAAALAVVTTQAHAAGSASCEGPASIHHSPWSCGGALVTPAIGGR